MSGDDRSDREKAGASALPSFLQRSDTKDEDIPVAAMVIAAVITIIFVGYAVKYLHSEQEFDRQQKAKQTKKRAERKAKKGKPLNDDDHVEDDPDAGPLEALKQAFLTLVGLVKVIELPVGLLLPAERYVRRISFWSLRLWYL